MESGGCPGYSADTVGQTTADLISAAGCTENEQPIDCLRALSPQQLLEALPPDIEVAGISATQYQPHVDGWALPDAPMTLIADGDYNPVPFVIGANADETARSVPENLTEERYETLVSATFSAVADDVLAQYPVSAHDSPWQAYTQLSTDVKFVCPARRIARAAR
jgi:para-nitrobenzyl esterase